VLYLIYTHLSSGLWPSGKCIYIRQNTHAHGITITYRLLVWILSSWPWQLWWCQQSPHHQQTNFHMVNIYLHSSIEFLITTAYWHPQYPLICFHHNNTGIIHQPCLKPLFALIFLPHYTHTHTHTLHSTLSTCKHLHTKSVRLQFYSKVYYSTT